MAVRRGVCLGCRARLVVAYVTAFDGTYTIDETPYKQQYMADAGGVPLKGGDYTNATAFREALRQADVIVDEAYWPFENGPKTCVPCMS
jgi:hypothetical protein